MHKIDFGQIKIRLANDYDLGAIVKLLADDELGKSREYTITDKDIPDCYLKAFDLIKANPNTMLVVMEYNGEIIGTLQLIIIPTLTLKGCIRAEVEGVRIRSDLQNLGLGKLLFDWVKKTAIENGCSILQLTTNNDRVKAQSFYKSIGFIDSHCGMKMVLA